MNKPAIVQIITRLDLGGAQKSCLALTKELQTNYPQFETYLITGSNGQLVDNAKKLKNTFFLDQLRWEVHPKYFFGELKALIKIIKVLRQLRQKHPNVIVHTHTIKAGTLGRWAALFAGVKVRIHTIHGFSFHPYQNKLVWLSFYLIELLNSLITSQFICVSTQDREAGSEIFPNFRSKSTIIRAATLMQPTKPTLFRPARRTTLDITIGTISCLKLGKNLFELLKAFQLAQKKLPELQLEIIGDGPLRPFIESYIQNHNLTEKVKLLGWIADPQRYYQHWDRFIFTSLWEGLPCALVEVASASVPIFTYNTGGISDLIDHKSLFLHGKWPELGNVIIKSFQTHPAPSKSPDLHEFYIPKMALDHAKLYTKLTPF